LFLRRPESDGFLAEAEFAELRAETLHFHAIRVVLGEEAFLEKQELVLGSVGVIDDSDEEPFEVDLDAGEKFGERGAFETRGRIKTSSPKTLLRQGYGGQAGELGEGCRTGQALDSVALAQVMRKGKIRQAFRTPVGDECSRGGGLT
jgi:hypothetical protein